VNVTNAARAGPILKPASAVLARADARAAQLWPRIRDAALLSIVAQYETMIQNAGLVAGEGRRVVPLAREWRSPQRPLGDLRRFFHILGIDVLVDSACEPAILELNDRPSMCVTDPIEEDLKSRVVYDALNVVTLDGADPCGWERLLPGASEPALARAVAQVVDRSCRGQQAFVAKLIARRLRYAPSAPRLRQSLRRFCVLPPLRGPDS
jgi:hypothetical protein